MSKDFKDLKENTKEGFENLLIVDGLNLAFRYKHANKKNFTEDFIRTISSLGNSYEAKKIVVLGDGGSFYRKNLYPEYKKSRAELRAKQTEEEAQDFKEFVEEVDKALVLLDKIYTSIKIIGVEADDIAAFITKYYSNEYEHIWLISSDKDWDLLVNDKVSRFSYRSRKEITADNWSTHYEYNLEDHISIKVLQGDKGDDVPGVEGIGEKRAYTLIKQYGTAFDIYDLLPIQSKYKYIENLNKFKENIILNYQLMDLITYCDEAIGAEGIKVIQEKMNG